MDAKITLTYWLQGFAALAGGVSSYLLLVNIMKGDSVGIALDAFCLLTQYWIFCYQVKLRNYIKEQNKWRKR